MLASFFVFGLYPYRKAKEENKNMYVFDKRTILPSKYEQKYCLSNKDKQIEFKQSTQKAAVAVYHPIVGCDIVTSRQKAVFELIKSLDLLKISITDLKYSYNKCIEIGKKPVYTDEEHEAVDAFFLRFARSSEFFRTNVLSKAIRLSKQTSKKGKDKDRAEAKRDEFEILLIKMAKTVETRKKAIHKINMNGEKQDLLDEVINQTIELVKTAEEAENLIAKKFKVKNQTV